MQCALDTENLASISNHVKIGSVCHVSVSGVTEPPGAPVKFLGVSGLPPPPASEHPNNPPTRKSG